MLSLQSLQEEYQQLKQADLTLCRNLAVQTKFCMLLSTGDYRVMQDLDLEVALGSVETVEMYEGSLTLFLESGSTVAFESLNYEDAYNTFTTVSDKLFVRS